ncbi:MAG: LAGLIDADG family homing endonuclease [Candidatus Woesearchaeota archaeon]
MKSSIVSIEQRNSEPTINLALDTIMIRKQCLIFVNTKRGAESLAEKISQVIFKDKKNIYQSHIDIEKLSGISSQILKVISPPTKQCYRLSELIKYGIAFHHSGLVSEQRKLIEENFRAGIIKIIVATPTLCLSADSRIWHGMSDTKISELNHSDKLFVLSKNHLQGMKALKVQKLANKDKLIQISTVLGYSVKLTPNHKILVKRDNIKKLIFASECNIKDKIATIGRINLEKISSCRFSDFVKIYCIPFNDNVLNEIDFYFIGAMIGDGYSGAEHKNDALILKGSPCIVGKDKEVFDKVKLFCNNHSIHYSYRLMPSKCDGLVLSKANWFREFLCLCGVEKGENKYIHDRLMNSSENNVAALLRGLFDTDGYVEKNKGLGISSISKQLIENIQRLLLRFGIVSRIRERKGKDLNIYEKEYKTKNYYELTILNNVSIQRFFDCISFSILRKKNALESLLDKINSNIKYLECKKCDYKLYYDLFTGRSKSHKIWSKQKLDIISLLGLESSTSNELKTALSFIPRKKISRLNHHYELIIRKRISSRPTEYMWSLNSIGRWIYSNILQNKKNFRDIFNRELCPLCNSKLGYVKKDTWRTSDFDGDIFWDIIKKIRNVSCETNVYDVVLPNRPINDHLFVAEGIIVHNSMGLDLPAFRVIIRDLKRYGLWGLQYIPVLEYEQQSGRAGRPSYDSFGEAICIADDKGEKQEIYDTYITGVPEPIVSKLAVEPIMRTYILSLIASGFIATTSELESFFQETFYAKHYGDTTKLKQIIHRMVEQLEEWGFIIVGNSGHEHLEDKSENSKDFVSALKLAFKKEYTEKLSATLLGHRVSELYLDPYTAHDIIESLKVGLKKKPEETFNGYSLIHLVCTCLELRPLLRVKSREAEDIVEKMNKNSELMLTEIPEMFDENYDDFLNSVKTTEFFMEWLDEKDEEYLLEKYDVRPGELHSKKELADWLLYSMEELSKLLKMHVLIRDVAKLRFRLKYGAREELIPLLQLKNVGRIRARKMFDNKIRDISDVKRVDMTTLSQLLGKTVALDVKKQVGQESSEEKLKVPENKRKGQINLGDYDG